MIIYVVEGYSSYFAKQVLRQPDVFVDQILYHVLQVCERLANEILVKAVGRSVCGEVEYTLRIITIVRLVIGGCYANFGLLHIAVEIDTIRVVVIETAAENTYTLAAVHTAIPVVPVHEIAIRIAHVVALYLNLHLTEDI